jgi:DNA-binding NarL/FixJ family response regulator
MPNPDSTKRIAVVDDHQLFRKGLISLVEMINDDYTVIFEASNGFDFQSKLLPGNLPQVVLMDINMPGMDGFATVKWLNDHYPEISVLVISMIEKEEIIVRMLKLGVKGYLSKDIDPHELHRALEAIINQGYYYTDFITGKLIHSMQHENGTGKADLPLINEREKQFLELACSELTYQQIADKMFLSPKTIDGYRNSLFEKLNVKSRTGLALYAVKNGLVSL